MDLWGKAISDFLRSCVYFFISLPMMGSYSKHDVGYGFLQATAIIMLLLAMGYAVLSFINVIPFSFQGLIQVSGWIKMIFFRHIFC